jgi:hypothetical protein
MPLCKTKRHQRSVSWEGLSCAGRTRSFHLEPGPLCGVKRTGMYPLFGFRPGASTSPESSEVFNGYKYSVKRKTQNVVDVFVSRLFVVVALLVQTAVHSIFSAANGLAVALRKSNLTNITFIHVEDLWTCGTTKSKLRFPLLLPALQSTM